jgi:hypothetical protein
MVNPTSFVFSFLFAKVIPLTFVVVGFAWLASLWHLSLDGFAILVGAIGWIAAYCLRMPVAYLGEKLFTSPSALRQWTVAASGPLEEIVRLIAILLIGSQINLAYAIGLGWGSIEIVYTLINEYFITDIMQRSDEEALAQQAALKEEGMIHEWGDWLGISERIFATAFHVGATLLVAKYSWLVMLNIVLHSMLNLIVDAIARDKAITAQIAIALFGGLFFATGLELHFH